MNITQLEARLAVAHNPAEAARLRARIAERRRHNAWRRERWRASHPRDLEAS